MVLRELVPERQREETSRNRIRRVMRWDPLNNEFSKSEEGTADYDNNKFSDTCYLSCIGNVTGFEDAGVEVKWANGITSKVAPYEIVRVDKHDGAASISVDEEVEDLSEDMIEHDKQFSRDKKWIRLFQLWLMLAARNTYGRLLPFPFHKLPLVFSQT
ncbi:hypothetical protein CsatB_007463 [Cannabis sativa]|uniref:uncharacterized protein LOC115713612 n=1 Tax=Cannabis sativa TaxID=3483 RepID=UPI0029CA788D|nr:uncharacterized protein LOC115713612 [Cannabis sativa]